MAFRGRKVRDLLLPAALLEPSFTPSFRDALFLLCVALWMDQILVGLALGIPAALLAGHYMASQLYEVGSYDPVALLSATLVLGLCATVAGLVSARRVASIEPMEALRTQ